MKYILKITSIPPHISIIAKLNAIKEKFNNLRNGIENNLKKH